MKLPTAFLLLDSLQNTGVAMGLMYMLFTLLAGGFLCLIVGVAWKIISYPTKKVTYINEWGNERTKTVDDTDYHYRADELWEPPAHWKQWKETGTYKKPDDNEQRKIMG